MIRKAYIIRVKEGFAEEYERRHNPIWEELAEVIKAHGIYNYSIFLHPSTRYLFCYMEIEDLNRLESLAESPICKRWWKSMTEVLEVTKPGAEKGWEEELKQVFFLP